MIQSLTPIRIATVAAFALATTATQAGVFNLYVNEASFLSALQAGAYTENFASLTPDTSPESLDFSGGSPSIGYRISAPGDFIYVTPPGDGFAQSVGQSDYFSPAVVDSFSQPINAIGGYFFNVDVDGVPRTGTLEFSLTDSGGTYLFNASTSPTTGPGAFFGVVTTAPITELSMESFTSGRFTGVANLTVGFAAVPEPSGYAAVAGLALGVFALVRRGRQTSDAKL